MLKSEHLSLTLRQHPWSQSSYNSLLIELPASAFSLLQSILNTALRDTVKKEIRSRHSSAQNPLIEIYFTLSKSPDHSWALNNVASPCAVDLTSCCSLPCSPGSSYKELLAVPWMPQALSVPSPFHLLSSLTWMLFSQTSTDITCFCSLGKCHFINESFPGHTI